MTRSPFARLAVILLGRGGASIALSAYLLTHRASWAEVFRAGAWYALVDGVLALASSILLGRAALRQSSRTLVTITLTDALLRLAVGAVVFWVPAIAEVPMTLIALFAAVGATACVLGAAAIILWMLERHRHRHLRHGAHTLYDPIPIIGMLSIAVGTLLVFDSPTSAAELRQVLAAGGLILGVSFIVSSVGAAMSGSHEPSNA